MKLLITLYLLVISSIAFAEVTMTSSDKINEQFIFSDLEIRTLAEEMREVAQEEMGDLYKYKCLISDNVEMKCTFKFNLPDDYCWYGAFEANAKYDINVGGVKARTYFSEVNWTADNMKSTF